MQCSLESITPTENEPSTSTLNPNSDIFISRFSNQDHVLNPLANSFLPSRTGFSNEVPNHINPLADNFSPDTLENTTVISEIFKPNSSKVNLEGKAIHDVSKLKCSIIQDVEKLNSSATSQETTPNDISKFYKNSPDLDTTPHIFECNTPNASLNVSFCCENEIHFIEFAPVREIVLHAINTVTSVICNRSDFD